MYRSGNSLPFPFCTVLLQCGSRLFQASCLLLGTAAQILRRLGDLNTTGADNDDI